MAESVNFCNYIHQSLSFFVFLLFNMSQQKTFAPLPNIPVSIITDIVASSSDVEAQVSTRESGFVKAQSDNLPKVDAFMMHCYFVSNPDFTSAEVKGVKAARSERESYGDAAIGYVQVKREGSICTVKARVTPEHNVRKKCYAVTASCDEIEETILSVQCEDCAAHLGGCKHAIAFLAWLHRRSEDPPTTSTDCYWKKSKLSSVGSSLKFVKAKDITPKQKLVPKTCAGSFLSLVKTHSEMVGDKDNQLMKYFMESNNKEKLSIHYLTSTIKARNPNDFIEHCKRMMTTSSCEEAALATLEQNDCPLCHELRYARFTASRAHEAAHCNVFNGSLTESIMGTSKFRDTKAMQRGRLLENEVLREVEKQKKNIIKKCGLKLNPNFPVIGASPGGESDVYSIEIKCPSSEKAMSSYISPGNIVSSKFMAQVQLQMHFSNKTHSDFEKTREVSIVEVQHDKALCENLLEKCTLFWTKAIFPMLYK